MELEEFVTFQDVVIVPRKAPVDPKYVVLESYVSKSISVSIPVLSSPMDTVTEHVLAAELARLGGVGVIHRNMSVEEQVREVELVKSASPGFEHVFNELELNLQIKTLSKIKKPTFILDNGRIAGVFLPVEFMEGSFLDKLKYIIKLRASGLVKPSLDNGGRLIVGAAVSPFDVERAKSLEKAGADFIVTDVAHLHNVDALSSLEKLVREVSIDVIAGNIGTREAVLDIVSRVENIGGFRVGISSGSICSTGVVSGAGVPTLTAVINARSALEELGLFGKIPIIADGGIRGPGDAAKAIVAGASGVMAGRLFAGTDEAPSILVRVGDKLYKTYRGMASSGAMRRRHAADRYSTPSKQLEEGVEGLVPYSGPLVKVVAELFFGLQASLGYSGAGNIKDAWNGRLARISPLGAREISPHDILT